MTRAATGPMSFAAQAGRPSPVPAAPSMQQQQLAAIQAAQAEAQAKAATAQAIRDEAVRSTKTADGNKGGEEKGSGKEGADQ